jgi:NAD(P)-dependent dehydrogenase (short-subunit alcohol dehydrogenase family)
LRPVAYRRLPNGVLLSTTVDISITAIQSTASTGNRALRPEVYERLRQRTPLGRFGQVGEIVGPVLFLLSKAASMVTGHVLAVDGGYLAS